MQLVQTWNRIKLTSVSTTHPPKGDGFPSSKKDQIISSKGTAFSYKIIKTVKLHYLYTYDRSK